MNKLLSIAATMAIMVGMSSPAEARGGHDYSLPISISFSSGYYGSHHNPAKYAYNYYNNDYYGNRHSRKHYKKHNRKHSKRYYKHRGDYGYNSHGNKDYRGRQCSSNNHHSRRGRGRW